MFVMLYYQLSVTIIISLQILPVMKCIAKVRIIKIKEGNQGIYIII